MDGCLSINRSELLILFFFFQVETIRGKTETGNKAITKLKQEDKGTNANIKVQIYSLSGHGRFISAHTLTTFSWLIIKDQENLLFFPAYD